MWSMAESFSGKGHLQTHHHQAFTQTVLQIITSHWYTARRSKVDLTYSVHVCVCVCVPSKRFAKCTKVHSKPLPTISAVGQCMLLRQAVVSVNFTESERDLDYTYGELSVW